jgi:large subunit ribosomal protein L9
MLAEDRRQQAHKLEAIKNKAIELGEKIKAVGTLTIKVKTSSNGKIFGTVGPAQIADALEKSGVSIDKKLITVKNPIKEVGSYQADAKLHKEVSVEIPIEVVSE